MPVAAKFSQALHDRLGHPAVDELVDWWNAMDESYRLELRQQNDANFARFEAKLDQRIAELRAELRAELAGLRAEMREGMANLRAELSAQLGTHMRWMLGMWATLFLAIIATWFSRR